TSLQVGQICCWRMRPPHFGWIWLNDTPPADAAVYIRIGMDTSPNETVPDPMECRGMAESSRDRSGHPGPGRSRTLAPVPGLLNSRGPRIVAPATSFPPPPPPTPHAQATR